MNRFLFFVGMLTIIGFLATVSADGQESTIRIGGSTTLLPIMANCSAEFMDQYPTWDKVDASLPKDNVTIFVTGGGSGFGVKSVINGVVHVGLVSRDLKEQEKKLLGAHQSYLVGKDAVAIAVNRKNPLASRKKDLTTGELAKIFSGEVKTYKELDSSLPAKPIVHLVRDASAGSAEIFQEKVMGAKPISPHALQLPSQGALLQKLQANDYAIAYISSGLAVRNKNLRTFAFNGIEPTHPNVISGSYPLSRPLLMVVKGSPDPTVQRFTDYALDRCQKTVSAHGYVPVKEFR